jgi:hypothetical protein
MVRLIEVEKNRYLCRDVLCIHNDSCLHYPVNEKDRELIINYIGDRDAYPFNVETPLIIKCRFVD